mgnify:CR=1 FL=1
MKKKFNFGILSTENNPLLPFYIKAMLKRKIFNIIIINDEKIFSNFDKKIWKERTNGYFENKISKEFIINKNIETYKVKNHNDLKAIRLYKKLNINCLLNAGTPRKLSNKLIKSMALGVINIHPGLLPFYRGCTAVEWSILNDDKVSNTAVNRLGTGAADDLLVANTSSDKIGIQTTNPQAALDVEGDIRVGTDLEDNTGRVFKTYYANGSIAWGE